MTETNASGSVEELFFQAELFAGLRKFELAEDAYQKALLIDKSPATRIAYGVFLGEQERYAESIATFTPILDGDNRTAIAIVCHNLAAIYREVGDLDLARRFQWRATLLKDSADETDLLGMANDALVAQQPETAAAQIMTACEMTGEPIEDCADGDLIATTGLAYAAEGSTKDALLTLFTAYRRHQAASDFRGMGADLMNMSALFGELNRHRTERTCVLRAIRCFQKAPAPLSLRNARQRLERLDRMDSIREFDVQRN
jgi:tetratricopeptide (TPR) repeat protein